MPRPPSFSVVVNTDSRARGLAGTLRGLAQLDYADFEVCVVHGPTPDGTREVLEGWRGRIKIASCPVRHLSISRNIGIALAAGEVVAFIDDDAMPEPEWLGDLASAYDDPAVGAAGGFVHDWDGVSYQYRHVTMNRLGDPDFSWSRAAPELNFPGTANFPHLLGTNCSFRRDALVAIGGFDENYERFLEESDVCCRLVDTGWKIAQIEGAYVHHKQLPDDLRTEERVIRRWYPIVRSKIYFGLVNARGHETPEPALAATRHLVQEHRRNLTSAIWSGKLGASYRARFEDEVARAWRDGLGAALSGRRKLMRAETMRDYGQSFHRFPAPLPSGGRKTFCLLTQNYPPGEMGGIARSVHQLARSIAELGHRVHVLTRGGRRDRIDLEEDVWVHRIVPRRMPGPSGGEPSAPRHIWDYSATMLAEAKRISRRRPVDCLYAPLWDCEAIAALLDGEFPLVLGLQTPMRSFLASHAHLAAAPRFMQETGTPLLTLERRLLEGAQGVHANSAAIIDEIERGYEIRLAASRTAVIPLGLEDWTTRAAAPVERQSGEVRLLFVGRLEARKGTDVLLPVLIRGSASISSAMTPSRQRTGAPTARASRRRATRASALASAFTAKPATRRCAASIALATSSSPRRVSNPSASS